MRKNITTFVAVSALCCASPIEISAMPMEGLGIALGSTAFSPVQDTRWFCANGRGRFLHWGRCGRRVYRVYCRNRFTHRFLHWGYC